MTTVDNRNLTIMSNAYEDACMPPVNDWASHVVSLFDSTRDPVFSVDRNLGLVVYNKALTEQMYSTWGTTVAPGKTAWDLMPPERAAVWTAILARALNEGPYQTEVELLDGRWIELMLAPIQPQGEVLGVSVISRDATERKRANTALRESEQRFRALFEQAPTAIRASRDGKTLFVNPRCVELFRYKSMEEMIGKPVTEFYAEESRPGIEENLRRAAAENLSISFDATALCADGVRVPVHMVFAAMELPDGPGVFAFITDTSEQKTAENALRESEARFRSYFELPLMGMATTLPDKGIYAVNDRLCEMLGYTREELMERSWAEITYPDDLNADVVQFQRLMAGEIDVYSLEKRYVRKDGRAIWASISVGCERKPDGGVDYVCGVVEDLSERKAAEAEVKARLRELRILGEMNEALLRAGSEIDLLKEYCRILVETGGYRMAWVGFAAEKPERVVVPMAHFGHEDHYLSEIKVTWDGGEFSQGPTGRAVRSGTIYVAEDFEADPGLATYHAKAAKRGFKSSIAVPFRPSADSMACLTVYGATSNEWSEAERRLMDQVASALGYGMHTLREAVAKEQSQRDLRNSLEQMIQVIADTVDRRDPYTAGHQRRVANLSVEIARKLGLTTERAHGLRLAATIHDLGKIGIPVEILSKPGRLTPLQMDLVKEHVRLGYDIVKDVQFPWPIADIILQHHERLDGSGYPIGLTGDAILLESKILAVADVVEAMATYRPYRAALGVEPALEEILKGRGVLYDADVVDACVRIFREDGYVMHT